MLLFAKQTHHINAVIFNNGLHGWHLDDDIEYAKYYESMIRFLINEFADIPIAVVLTTHVADEDRDKRVEKRNRVAVEIAEKYGLPVIDFYKVSLENKSLLTADGVHFTDEGYEALADTLTDAVKNFIK